MSKRSRELLFMGGLAAYMVVMLLTDTDLSAKTLAYPRAIIIVTFILLGLKLLTMFVPAMSFLDPGSREAAQKAPKEADTLAGKEETGTAKKWTFWILLAWLSTFALAIYLIGFLPAMPIWLFLFTFFISKLSPVKSLLISLGMLAGVYAAFVLFLNMYFPAGLLFR